MTSSEGPVLHIDFETRSTVELSDKRKGVGAHAYAEHPTTDLWCACYAFDDGPVETWRPGEPCPAEVYEHTITGGVLCAHNAAFERVIWRYILTPRYGWPEPAVEQWRCTMAMAYALALPGSLEMAAPAAGLDHRKDAAGHRLMLQLARPRKLNPLTWWDDSAKLERLIAYCRQDVEVERALHARLRPLQPSELALWHLDQRINDRGVYVDEALCNAAKKIVAEVTERLNVEMREATNFAVSACSNRNQIIAWVREQGVETKSIAKDQVEELLAQDIPPHVRRVLNLRRESAKASVAKIDALLRGRNADGRARGLLQYHSANTGRWGGRRFQPQNLKRPDLDNTDIGSVVKWLLSGTTADELDTVFGEPLSVIGDCLRAMVMADGKRIIAADYANIEGRVLAWLAGEEWKLGAFRAYDAGTGPDLYKVAYGRSYGLRPEEVTKPQRQIGKVMELALGYQGGVGAFKTMGVNYDVDLPDHEVEGIRDGWRSAHPRTKQLWRDMEDAAIAAVQSPGVAKHVGRIAFKKVGSFLYMRLPSGRLLAYPYPKIREKEMPWTNDDGSAVWKDCLTYFTTIDVAKRAKIVDDPNNTSDWARIATYGGMLAENATQATARDILAAAMPKLEAAGYPIILTVHDEIVAEVDLGHGSVADFERIMCDLPAWAEGCPVTAEGFEAERYRK